MQAFEKGRTQRSVNLDFDARVPIPFSVFPSSYRSDAVSETTHTRVEGEVKLEGASRVGREDTRYEGQLPDPRQSQEEFETRAQSTDFHHHHHHHQQPSPNSTFQEEERPRDRYPEVELSRERYYESRPQREFESQLDITEREFRERTDPRYQAQYEPEPRYTRDVDVSYNHVHQPIDSARPPPQVREVDVSYNHVHHPIDTARPPPQVRDVEYQPPRSEYRSTVETAPQRPTVERSSRSKMGYYDDDGQYHSFRRGVERAADRIMHPFHHGGSRDESVVADERAPSRHSSSRESVRVVQPRGGHPAGTITIPCHFIRIGDLLILQGRPCQVIRVSVSPQTGQHRYLGVDLFTRQLHEESSFISNPSPSVVVQSMLGPVYKTYRILDLHDDGHLVAMTENGDVKQGIRVVDQGGLFNRISDAFSEGRGSVRALVINDGGRELVVDYKVIHGSRL